MIWVYVFLGVLFLLSVMVYLSAVLIFRQAFMRAKPPKPGAPLLPVSFKDYWAVVEENVQKIREYPAQDVSITSHDGLRLVGRLYLTPGCKRTIICCHGYHSGAFADFSCAFDMYRSLGYNLLLIDQRAHGRSEGKYIGFGVLERQDCKRWVEFINERLGDDGDIFLSGISMGCATALMATGLELPGNLRGIIADCGFVSPYEIVSHVGRRFIRPISALIIQIIDGLCRRRAGYGLREYGTLDAMARNTIPVLFLHGTDDKLVPAEMTLRNYDACAGPKEILLVPGAGHGLSYLVDPVECRRRLVKFLNTYSTAGADAAEAVRA